MAHNRALVRRPSPLLAKGIVTHIGRQKIDIVEAVLQWQGYVNALRDHGWDIIEVMATPDCPDGVFIEDQVVVYGDTAILCRSGAKPRRLEQIGLSEVLTDNGYQVVQMDRPAKLDGGDVLKHGGHVWVGDGGKHGRTNQAGFNILAQAFSAHGAQCHFVSNHKALHLKSALTALPDGRIIGWDPVVEDPASWPGYVSALEEPGAHVVVLDERHLLMSTSAPRTAQWLSDQGYSITAVNISEYEKLEGCVTCLSVRLRG